MLIAPTAPRPARVAPETTVTIAEDAMAPSTVRTATEAGAAGPPVFSRMSAGSAVPGPEAGVGLIPLAIAAGVAVRAHFRSRNK